MPKKRDIQFYSRYDDKNHFLTDLKDSFRNSQEAYIFTYVFDNVGYDLICGGTTNKKQIKLLVNISESGVFEDLDALKELFRISKTKRHKIKIKYYTVKNGLFHPKLYFFTNGNTRVVFIGSSNFTGAGLYYKNVETNVRLTGEDTATLNKIGEYCKRQWKDADPLNENILGKLKSPKHESSISNDNGEKKIPPSKGKFSPWHSSHSPIKSHAKRRKVAGANRISTVKEVKEFEELLEREISEIIHNDRKQDYYNWKQRYGKDKAAAEKLSKSKWDYSDFHHFIDEVTEIHSFGSRFSNICKRISVKRNQLKLKRLFYLLYKKGNVNALEETKNIKYFGWWILPTFLLHLNNPKKYNIHVSGCGNIVLKQKLGLVKLQRGSGVSERYKAFNGWANKVREEHGLTHYEMDILFARVGDFWSKRDR